ncbi:MAG: cupin domain-containing protein [Gemmatimonadetes bacterium]|nr:cupin domain-containing protein [Gemmatimonadota bacterium]
MKHIRHVRLNELDPKGGPIFEGLRRQTPWSAFDYWILAPGERRQEPATTGGPCEQGYVFMDGPVELTVGQQQTASGEGPGFIVESTGITHELKNLTDIPVQVLRVRVAMDVDAETQDVQPKVGTFDEQALKWRDAIHGGCGQIATRHVLSPDDFCSDWTFLDHAILSAGGSVGYHYHDFLEESFVVLRGQGLMTIADETFAVGPGSVTWQGIGQGHGIYNPGPEKLEFVRIAVKQANETYTTIDLHDDLSAHRPT